MSYRQVSGYRRWFSRYRWYAAPDHWLLMRRRLWFADYRRVFLQDVTSVVIYSRHRERVRAMIWAGLGGGLAWPCWQFGALRTGWVLLTLGAAAVIYEFLQGEFGEAEIRTATSAFAFPLASRWRQSQRVATQLRAAVEEVQGGGAPAGDWILPPIQTGRSQRTERLAPGRWSWALWTAVLLLLADGLLQLRLTGSGHAIVTSSHGLSWVLSLGSWALGILAAIAAFRYRCVPGTRLLAVIFAVLYPVQLTVYVTAALITGLRVELGHGIEIIGWQQRFAVTSALYNGGLEVVLGTAAIIWFFTQGRHYETPELVAPETVVTAE